MCVNIFLLIVGFSLCVYICFFMCSCVGVFACVNVYLYMCVGMGVGECVFV